MSRRGVLYVYSIFTKNPMDEAYGFMDIEVDHFPSHTIHSVSSTFDVCPPQPTTSPKTPFHCTRQLPSFPNHHVLLSPLSCPPPIPTIPHDSTRLRQHGKRPRKARSQTPIIQIPQVPFKHRVDTHLLLIRQTNQRIRRLIRPVQT